jgi:GT2 family glycosyltransferase
MVGYNGFATMEQLHNRVAVCVLFYNKVEQTIECVSSFLGAGAKIYILDNGSEASALQILTERFVGCHQVEIVSAGKNLGVAGGRNRQIQVSRETWLFFVDNDITVATSDWLPRINAWIDRVPGADVLVPRLFNKHEDTWGELADFVVDEQGRCSFLSTPSVFANSFPGGASIIRRRVFEEVGLYDEELFVGFEDFELAIRAWKMHRPLLVRRVTDVELVHDHRVSLESVDRQSALIRYDVDNITRSHAVVQRKHGVLLNPNFRQWLQEQVLQITGEPGHDVGPSAETSVHFSLDGPLLTPIQTGGGNLALLVAAEGDAAELWQTLRAVRIAREMAETNGLHCQVYIWHGELFGEGRRLVAQAVIQGLAEQAVVAGGEGGRWRFPELERFAFLGIVTGGLLGSEFLARGVQCLNFEPEAVGWVLHPEVLALVRGNGQGLRLERQLIDPLAGELLPFFYPAILMPAKYAKRFAASRAANGPHTITEVVMTWLCELAANGIVQRSLHRSVVLHPL